MTVFTDGIIDTVFTGSIGDGGKNYFLFILKKKIFFVAERGRGGGREISVSGHWRRTARTFLGRPKKRKQNTRGI